MWFSCNYFKNRRDFLLFEIDERIVPPKIDFRNKTITIFIQGETDIYLYERIGVLIKVVAKQNSYTHVINSQIDGNSVILYAEEKTDISDLVIAEAKK